MIARLALSAGIVWLCMPQHPDLGIQAASVFAADTRRSAIIQRLAEIKSELRGINGSEGFSVVGVLDAVDETVSLGSHRSVHRLTGLARAREIP